MDDAPDSAKCAIKREMCRRIGTWLEFSFDHLSGLDRHDDHVGRSHCGVGNAGRFDDYQLTRAVNAAGVAPSLNDQALPDQIQVGLAHGFFE
jgi:hypothetical protein